MLVYLSSHFDWSKPFYADFFDSVKSIYAVIHYSTVQYSTVQYSTVDRDKLRKVTLCDYINSVL
jgi:hypothetical protein